MKAFIKRYAVLLLAVSIFAIGFGLLAVEAFLRRDPFRALILLVGLVVLALFVRNIKRTHDIYRKL